MATNDPEYHWTFDAEAFESRLSDLGALGDCKACGTPGGRSHLDPAMARIETAAGGIMTYVAICPTCGHMEFFTPSVLQAWDDSPEGAGAGDPNA